MKILDILRNRGKRTPNFTLDENIIKTLDPSIVPLIKLCNENGIQTFACCSGDLSEHIGEKYEETNGYMAFQDSQAARELVAGLMDYGDIEVNIISAPSEPYEYFGQIIERERFAIYFLNKFGENMQTIYDRINEEIHKKEISRDNLKLVNSIIDKFREQRGEFEYSVEFNFNCETLEIRIDINEMFLLDDQEHVGNVKALVSDIASILGTTYADKYFNRVYVPKSMEKNILPVIDLIKQTAWINREKYSIAKRYDEAYYNDEAYYYDGDECGSKKGDLNGFLDGISHNEDSPVI